MDLSQLKKLVLLGLAMGATQPVVADDIALQQQEAGIFVAGCGSESCKTTPKKKPEEEKVIAEAAPNGSVKPKENGQPQQYPTPSNNKTVRFYQKRDRQIADEEANTMTPPPKGAWKNSPNTNGNTNEIPAAPEHKTE